MNSGLFLWFKKVLSEANGVPSSVRVCLFLIVAGIFGCAVYVIVQHALHNTMVDIPKNLADLLSFAVGSLAAAKAGSKFGESDSPVPPQPQGGSAKATDPML
jgi:hypothetical protein